MSLSRAVLSPASKHARKQAAHRAVWREDLEVYGPSLHLAPAWASSSVGEQRGRGWPLAAGTVVRSVQPCSMGRWRRRRYKPKWLVVFAENLEHAVAVGVLEIRQAGCQPVGDAVHVILDGRHAPERLSHVQPCAGWQQQSWNMGRWPPRSGPVRPKPGGRAVGRLAGGLARGGGGGGAARTMLQGGDV
jgi:hypothetical protein